jgi:hypothetical protein
MSATTSLAKEYPDGSIPLWLAVHEAGHVISRLQLVAAWHLDGLNDPSSLDCVRVWIDERGTPRGLCQWGKKERFSFLYQALISVAGPAAEARIRDAEPRDCLTASEDHEMIMRSVRHGLADIDKALKEATSIVSSCWPEIMKLATHLQIHNELTFPQISTPLEADRK